MQLSGRTHIGGGGMRGTCRGLPLEELLSILGLDGQQAARESRRVRRKVAAPPLPGLTTAADWFWHSDGLQASASRSNRLRMARFLILMWPSGCLGRLEAQ